MKEIERKAERYIQRNHIWSISELIKEANFLSVEALGITNRIKNKERNHK